MTIKYESCLEITSGALLTKQGMIRMILLYKKIHNLATSQHKSLLELKHFSYH
jgi:hypothetical protein